MKARITPKTSMLQEFFNSLDRLRNSLIARALPEFDC
jgi:hypothetical protein